MAGYEEEPTLTIDLGLEDESLTDYDYSVNEGNRLAQHFEVKNNTLQAVSRLEETKERIEEEIGDWERLVEKQDDAMVKPRTSDISTFKKVGNEFVDQDKMERMRQGRLKAQAIREAAQRDILAWREEFRAKFAKGSNPSIRSAGPELVMTAK